MRGLRRLFVAFFLLFSISMHAHAQRQVVLGNSTTELSGLWKFHTGDDMRWADPSLDDSTWGTMDVTPLPGSYDPFFGTSGYVPGWTARGYRAYSGYAWYRLRVNIQNNAENAGQEALALKMPDNFDDSYQVYVNGRLIGQFGQFTAHGVTEYIALPRAFPLPANVRSGPVTLAIRMWMDAATPLIDPDAGGLHAPPVLGHASAIAALLQLDWDATNRTQYGYFPEMAILLLALLVALALFWMDRKEPAYLWLSLTCAAILGGVILSLLSNYTAWITGTSVFFLRDVVVTPVHIGLWVIFWGYWFRLDRMGRLHRTVWSLVLLLVAITAMLRAPLYGSLIPVHATVWLSPLTVVLKLLLGALLVWVTYQGIRRNKAEGWLALPAVVLVVLSLYQEELLLLHAKVQFFPFGLVISITQIAAILSLGIITVLLVRRFLRSQREQEQWKLEMEQARHVQSLLVPTTAPRTPGFAVESVYLPASSVGGDFFQVQSADDGSLLVVVGDVSGKGLQAAMTVSTIVGALRDYPTHKPAEILTHLNRVLHGRVGGFVTCCALLLSPDGELTLANAGHLPPYLNGAEIAMEGSLPLGPVANAEFPVMRFRLAEGDTLTLISDGIVEAQNEHKELFGFARTGELMLQHKSAVEIAAVAQQFGQEDDITVLRVMREATA